MVNKDSPRLLKFNNVNTDTKSSSNEQLKSVTKTDTAIKQANANTVEGLFLSLDKIEKESLDLLKLDNNNNKSAKLDDLLSDTISDEKVNSILSFLDEASSNDANNFVPKAFKDYNIDFNQYYTNLEAKKPSNDASQATSRQKPVNKKIEPEIPKKAKPETPKPSLINSSISVKQPVSKQVFISCFSFIKNF